MRSWLGLLAAALVLGAAAFYAYQKRNERDSSSRVNALEELLEARRAADQWKLKGHQIEWLIHRGKRLSHAKNLIERGRLAYSELSAYLEECEKHFHSQSSHL